MNEQLQEFARKELIDGLSKCSEKEQLFFKRMYSASDLTLSINEVVANMPEEKLDMAMQQVANTVARKDSK